MRTTLGGVLAIDKRIVVFAVGSAMCKCDFDVVIFEVNNWIERIAIHVVFEKVFEAIFGIVFFAVVVDRKPPIQVAVVPHHFVEVGGFKAILLENAVVWNEFYVSAISFVGFFDG